MVKQLNEGSPAAGNLIPLARQSRRAFLGQSGTVMLAGSAAAAALAASGQWARGGQVRLNQPLSRDYLAQIRQHERDHVAFLVQALGSSARPKPTFQNLAQKGFNELIQTSQALENTGVGAYLGAAPYINDPDYLAAAGSILTVEARHAGFLNFFDNDPLTGDVGDANASNQDSNPSFDVPLTPDQVVTLAGPFVADLNGGPPLDYSTTPSDDNDVAILNFALALEYLESDFYDLNVPKFFKGL